MYNEHYFEQERDDDHEPVIYSGALRHIQDHLTAILDVLYGNGSIDLDSLENSLDEVANGLGLSLPRNDLNIRRGDTKICQFENESSNCNSVCNLEEVAL